MALLNKTNDVLRGATTTAEFYKNLQNELSKAWDNYSHAKLENNPTVEASTKALFFKLVNNWRQETIIAERKLEGTAEILILEAYCYTIIETKDALFKDLRIIATETINPYKAESGELYRAGEFKKLTSYLKFRELIELNMDFLPNKEFLGIEG